jgi:hypothetical protein
VTIARRRASALATIAMPVPASPGLRVPAPPAERAPSGAAAGLHDIPAPEATVPAGRLRRCTFRRLDRVAALPGRAPLTSYEVMCLYGGAEAALSLGDIESAKPACESCTATGIFRPDEA